MKDKKRIFSGIKPSGDLTIGNYIGAISQWVEMQDSNDCVFSVVDYHAITVKQDPDALRRRILDITKIYLAAGIDPERSIIFQQSDVPAHTELAWILNTKTNAGELKRMRQFNSVSGILSLEEQKDNLYSGMKREADKWISEMEKRMLSEIHDKYQVNKFVQLVNGNKLNELATLLTELVGMATKVTSDSSINYFSNTIQSYTRLKEEEETKFNKVGVGLFDYPVLMAADILLYDTDAVPVGEDQKQHVELARDIAKRFNNEHGKVFTIPEAVVKKEGARIMGLVDPKKKMSKSADSANAYIALLDEPEAAMKKIMKAVTDSGTEIEYDPEEKPALANLLQIYASLGNRQIPRLVKDNAGRGYGDFKKDLAEVVGKFLSSFQEKFKAISDDDAKEILEEGRKKAAAIAQKKLDEVKKVIGVK